MQGVESLLSHREDGVSYQAFFRRTFIVGVVGSLISSGAEAGNERFESVGNMRKIMVRGADLDQIHSIAANTFTKKLESDFKNPNAYYGVRKFHTEVKRAGNEYEFVYSLELVPVSKTKSHFRVVQIMGTVYHDRDAERKVKDINGMKIPKWKSSMENKFSGMQYLLAESKQGDIYHEAILGLGR